MLAPSADLLRAGLGLKLNLVKRASRAYVRDRARQAGDTASAYAIAAGLFAVAGILVLAAFLVGLGALFRFVEMTWGAFWAFGVVAAVLLVLAVLCAVIAAARLRKPPPEFPSLTSRLRVALMASPLSPATEPGASPPEFRPSPAGSAATLQHAARELGSNRNVQVALFSAATLLALLMVRRRQARRRSS